MYYVYVHYSHSCAAAPSSILAVESSAVRSCVYLTHTAMQHNVAGQPSYHLLANQSLTTTPNKRKSNSTTPLPSCVIMC
jgi:hypothetical protein